MHASQTCAIVCALAMAALACSQPKQKQTPTTPPATPAPRITTATFEPVYRSSKALQGATAAGVNAPRFSELLQSFSTELAIAKDHQLTPVDKELLALYEEAYRDYALSATFWQMKLNASGDLWKGEIPIGFGPKRSADEDKMAKVAAPYGIVVADRRLRDRNYRALPSDAIQRVWQHADAVLAKATATYYGR